jgi:Family of unknown function (DUF5681)
VLFCELPDGATGALPAWMTDAAACAALTVGAIPPRPAPAPSAEEFSYNARGGALRATSEQRRGRGSGGVTGRGFRPGQSGNPTGRGRATLELRDVARTYTEEAVRTLVTIMRSDRSPAAARVAAAQAVLDRAWGRAVQALEHSGPEGSALLPVNLTVLTDVQLAQLAWLLEDIAQQASTGIARVELGPAE